MTTAALSYFTNLTADQGRRFFDGWQAGDPLTLVATRRVNLDRDLGVELLAEQAFAYFQRIDAHPELDAAQAPSMSIGDIVVVSDEDQVVHLAVERFGFRRLNADEAADVARHMVKRGDRTVVEVRRELEVQR